MRGRPKTVWPCVLCGAACEYRNKYCVACRSTIRARQVCTYGHPLTAPGAKFTWGRSTGCKKCYEQHRHDRCACGAPKLRKSQKCAKCYVKAVEK